MNLSPATPPFRAIHAFLVVMLLSSAFLALDTREPVTAASPLLDLRPDRGQPGTQILVRGRHFPGNADGSLVWAADGSVLAQVRTERSGNFSVPFVIPSR